MSVQTININVPVLARVEGEGALDLVIENEQITDLKLRIYEPPRYFEKLLQGRNYYDVVDTVARICGICPVAYQMSATHALESIFGTQITPWIRAMRRLFYCGEWLQSHSLHIHLLAAPDYLGYNSVIEMAAQHETEVRRGLRLQALGNDLIALFGARSVHPVGAKVGGFSKAPDQEDINALLPRVSAAKQDAADLIRWLDTLELPEQSQDFVSVALHHDGEYPLNEGRLISDNGLEISITDFEKHFKEFQVDHSTALHCLLEGKPYLVGPLARVNLNKAQLPDDVKHLMQGLKAQFPSKNMFHSIIARAIEIYFSILEAESLLMQYQKTEQPSIEVDIKAGTGYGCTEAPRGILWHRYDIDKNGCVEKAIIVPPTSQNQPRIEQDIKFSLINFGLNSPKKALQLHAEKVIRNYDPCISCATHFLDLNLIRNGISEKNVMLPTFDSIELSRTAIIGIGSPNEGDQLGWQMIDKLSQQKAIPALEKRGLCLCKLDRPGVSLVDTLSLFDYVLVVDALKSSEVEQSYILLDGHRLKTNSNPVSSHACGVFETLSLLESIHLLPKQLVLLGISCVDDEVVNKVLNMF